MLVQIHILQNYAPSNLNRDDSGAPKDAIFGGAKRGRISSQCIKRSMRHSLPFQEKFENGQLLAMRTKRQKLDIVENNFETNTHVLRQMTGRRYKTMEPGEYKSVQNPDYPVTRDGHWTDVPYDEQLKSLEVNDLKVCN